ncbi:MAG: repair protein RecO protein, partial [Candidatus Giovannonibacteria bacterium GW2011_GWA2_53_7]
MARVEHVTGIILERRPLMEHDRRLTVWTKEAGKLEPVAKGTLKPESKLAGSLEPLTEVRLSLTRGRTDRVISSTIIQSWPGLRQDLRALAAASFAAQAVSRLTQVGLPDPALFSLLQDCLSSLDDQAVAKHPLIVRKFLWRLFDRLGFRPRLDACVRCNKTLPAGGYYSA